MIKTGDIVRMSEEFKHVTKFIYDNHEHIDEFGNCFGLVEDLCFDKLENSEFNVRWFPSELRYGYSPDDLEIIKLLI